MQEVVDLLGSFCLVREYEREVELYDYIEVLFKYKWFIIVATLICGSIGWVLRPAPTPPLYEADVVLMIKNLPNGNQQSEIPTGGMQTSGFYQALALADDLKQALIDSLNLDMPLVAMDGLLQVQVLDPGIRLSVSSHDHTLPIKVANKWAQLFVERNSDLTLEEAGTYYNYVRDQYETAKDTLNITESGLNKLEVEGESDLRIQQIALDTVAINIFQATITTDNSLKKKKLELREVETLLQSAETTLANIGERATSTVSLDKIRRAQAQLQNTLNRELQTFDESNNVRTVKKRLEAAELDSLRIQTKSIEKKINSIERELRNHEPLLGPLANPTYVSLSSQLSKLRLEYELYKSQNSNIFSSNDTINDGTQSLDEILHILQLREEIINRYQNTEDKLNAQANRLLDGQYQELDNYSDYLSLKDSRSSEYKTLIFQKKSQEEQLKDIQQAIANIKSQLSSKVDLRQSLLRDREIFSQTVARFSKLLEEARITREKAAGDIRVLTRALKVRPVPQEQGRHKTTIAAGVGFLLSCILSLLAEYIRKARHNRLETQQKSA
jgi:hypothetical protein